MRDNNHMERSGRLVAMILGYISANREPSASKWVALPLRLIVGFGFFAHGYAKLLRGPANFAAVLLALHVPAPSIMSWLTIAIEMIGGLAVLAGAFVTLMSVPLAAVLLVAAITVHLPFGFSSIKLLAVTNEGVRFGQPGYELDLLYLACLVALVLGGSGPFAIDTYLSNRKRKLSAARRASA